MNLFFATVLGAVLQAQNSTVSLAPVIPDAKTEEFNRQIKDLKVVPGAFPIYLRKHDILMEVPADRLDHEFVLESFLGTGISPAGLQAGDPIGDQFAEIYCWERHEDRLILVRPNLRFRWRETDQLNTAAERSFPSATLGSFSIIAEDPARKVFLINASSLVFGPAYRLGEGISSVVGGQFSMDRELFDLNAVKSFKNQTLLDMHLHYSGSRGMDLGALGMLFGFQRPENNLEDTRSVPVDITVRLAYLQDNDYTPRLADPRVGFFTVDYFSLDRFYDHDRTDRLITRYNFEQKEGTDKVLKPMVWILDSSIPKQYRKAVRDGILRWNPAFSKIGLKGAIVVKDQDPKDDTYDHSDPRFNVVRWTMSSDAAYAMAIPRVDPATGEITGASITFDANFLAYILNEHHEFSLPNNSNVARSMTTALRGNLDDFHADQFIWSSDKDLGMVKFQKALAKQGWNRDMCEMAPGLAKNAAFGLSALKASGIKISKEDYASQFISDVICHEVGHCLGLRHNFSGSTGYSLTQLADDSFTATHGTTASVMDYVPVNVQAVLKGRGTFFSECVGPYDEWAIEYGYKPVNADSLEQEHKLLLPVADRSAEGGRAFASDEMVNSWDPFVVAYDGSNDPIGFAERMLLAAKRTEDFAIKQMPQKGDSFEDRTRLILESITQVFEQGRDASRFVGGVQSTHDHSMGDPNQETLRPVSSDLQRRAMHLITKHCLASDAFVLPKSVMLNLSLSGFSPESQTWIAPMRETLFRYQAMTIASVLNSETIDRISENSYKLGEKNGYNMSEHYGLLLGAVFNDVEAPEIDGVRRDVQKFAIEVLMAQAGASPLAINEDARAEALDALHRLHKRYLTASNGKASGPTRTFLRECEQRLTQFLNRKS